jgi:hypothetical protein
VRSNTSAAAARRPDLSGPSSRTRSHSRERFHLPRPARQGKLGLGAAPNHSRSVAEVTGPDPAARGTFGLQHKACTPRIVPGRGTPGIQGLCERWRRANDSATSLQRRRYVPA